MIPRSTVLMVRDALFKESMDGGNERVRNSRYFPFCFSVILTESNAYLSQTKQLFDSLLWF